MPALKHLACIISVLALLRGLAAADDLAAGFDNPPPQARPWVYWYFMDGNMSREGLTADLEAMREAGIGGAIFLEVNLGLPRGPVEFMSPEWRQLFVHAVREAERLGIEIALGSGPGWAGTGGPWVKTGESMQHLVASETHVSGPANFDEVLPRPEPRTPFFGKKTLTPELTREWQEFYRDVAVLAFPKPANDKRLPDADEKAIYQRAPYTSMSGVKAALPMPAAHPAWPAEASIPRDGVLDLTSQLTADGRLQWDAPPGEWIIQRFVRTPTGQTTRPAPKPGLGFETDKFNAAAVEAHLDSYVEPLIREIGPRKGPGGLSTLHFDSWEMSSQNWSENFREDFKRLRGYDPLRFLPAFTGRVVENVEMTERFLWDLRQTAQELVIANHVEKLKERAHKHGLLYSNEPYDMNPNSDLSLGAVADVPMGEFWWLGFDGSYSVIEAASIAHTNGRRIVGAESFTSNPGEDWRAHPANIKSLGDWAFAAGANRIVFHRYQHQPWLDRRPGMRMWNYGVHWERTQTWWPMVSAYHHYLTRCQYLLRRGQAVADILYLAAEGAPHVFRAPASAIAGNPPDRREYNFDACAPDTLITRAEARDGMISFPGGSSYRLLALPDVESMTPALLCKIRELAQAGVTVIGPPPEKSPSLSGHPQCDEEVRQLVSEMWSETAAPGRVLWNDGISCPPSPPNEAGQLVSTHYPDYAALARVLRETGVPPDFSSKGPIRHTHRTDEGTEIYFVANREEKLVDADCSFRAAGMQPELWHPVTGERHDLTDFSEHNGLTTIPLRFEPLESYFIIFRRAADAPGKSARNFTELRTSQEITGDWQVSFDPEWGGPERVGFPKLDDWSTRPEPGIRHYSGMATYHKTFELAAAKEAARSFIDLGVVKNMARVKLNGRDLGIVWCPPWRLECTGVLKPGANELEITVANLWINRLIGDAALPDDQKLTWTSSNPYTKDSPLAPSGLLGPVLIQHAAEASPAKD